MADLAEFRFTNKSDRATSPNEGWLVGKNVGVFALRGGDIIAGRGSIGVENLGAINSGSGKDILTGLSRTGLGILNNAKLEMGEGDDRIDGTGRDYGIFNGITGLINTGAGNDLIRGTGMTGGITNSGVIKTGSGNDIVDALDGGIRAASRAEAGVAKLGSGNDTLKGPVIGEFSGGKGFDTLILLGSGYSVKSLGGDVYKIGTAIIVSGFEAFGPGADQPDLASAAAAGSVQFSLG